MVNLGRAFLCARAPPGSLIFGRGMGLSAMYVILRFLSVVLIGAALMFLGADLITSLERGGALGARSIEQVWALFSKSSEADFSAWLGHALPLPLAHWIGTVLSLPAWSLPGVLGVVLAILFGRRTIEA
jgi:hypothetical protein